MVAVACGVVFVVVVFVVVAVWVVVVFEDVVVAVVFVVVVVAVEVVVFVDVAVLVVAVVVFVQVIAKRGGEAPLCPGAGNAWCATLAQWPRWSRGRKPQAPTSAAQPGNLVMMMKYTDKQSL